MKKLIPVVFALFFLASCTSSKVFPARTCMVCLKPTDGILLIPLAWEPTFRALSEGQKIQLERQILSDLRKEGFTKVELLDRLDYELLREGIKDLNDSVQREKIHSKLGYSYLIGITLGPTREGEGWSYQRPEEAFALESVPDMEVSALLRMALISMQTGAIEADYSISSKNHGWSFEDKDEGMEYWSFADVYDVIRHGTHKGVSELVKGCGC